MMLKPQGIVILLKLVTLGYRSWSYSTPAYELAMSPSEVHGDVRVTIDVDVIVEIVSRVVTRLLYAAQVSLRFHSSVHLL